MKPQLRCYRDTVDCRNLEFPNECSCPTLHRLHSQEMASAEVEYRKKLQHDQQILEKLHGKELAELNSERAQQQEELKMTMEKARIDVELRMGNEKAVIEKWDCHDYTSTCNTFLALSQNHL